MAMFSISFDKYDKFATGLKLDLTKDPFLFSFPFGFTK